MGAYSHIPVLLSEVVSYLDVRPGGIYVDGTLGGGGHSEEILERLCGTGRLIGIDRDETAIEAAGERLRAFKSQTTFIKGNFADTPEILWDLGIENIDGMLLDLGVSSFQLDTPERGFSYRSDAPLDMRMDTEAPLTAGDVVNTYPEDALRKILFEYGQERSAGSIAALIVKRRREKPIETTKELSDIVLEAVPPARRRREGHPAKKTFQAIRIETNDELEALKRAIDGIIEILSPGGRLAVISFHSLEDRIVKTSFKKAENPCICPPDLPVCVCGRVPKGKVLTKRAVTPREEELKANRRSHSAKLRVFERIWKPE